MSFGEVEDDEVSEGELATLRSQVLQSLTFKPSGRSALRPEQLNSPPATVDAEAMGDLLAREAVLWRMLEKSMNRSAARDQYDDILYVGEPKSASGAKGLAKKAELDRKFAANPGAKYKHVIAEARQALGVGQEHYDDANAMKYFRDFVPLGKYKMGMHMFEQINEMHAAVIKNDQARLRGLIAASYQFLEQYSIDSSPGSSDFYLVHFATHRPALGLYPS